MRVEVAEQDVHRYSSEAEARDAFRQRRGRLFATAIAPVTVISPPVTEPSVKPSVAPTPNFTYSTPPEKLAALKRLNRRIHALNHLLDRLEDRRAVLEQLAQPSVETIMRAVCAHFSVSMMDLQSGRRERSIVRPRQIAAYLAKIMTSRSLPQIGRKMGGRDHTTIIASVRKIEKLRAADKDIEDAVVTIEAMLRGRD